ncbi:sulfurtransferase [Aquimarina pacifica]|uniref:sulfurtransferase n=1 Tax=Aquimarina pacifica TaxID=1296415 RepID=UPI00046E7121|nr:sulfurtransferase [Aquimarina pacifica]
MNTLEITQPLVSIDWLSKHLNHPNLIVLDTTIPKIASQKAEQYSGLGIKNARFFDIKKTFSNINTEIPNMLPSTEQFVKGCMSLGISNHHTIVVYDTLGIYSSPRVWWMFKIMGHHNIAVLDGGFPAWKKADLPSEPINTNKKTYNIENFDAEMNHELVIDASSLINQIDNKNSLILDARSPGRFNALEPEPRASLTGGHIPNSINLHYMQLLDNGKMLPIPELKQIFNKLKIKDTKLIFTCGSGITACILMLGAALAGYHNVSVYDGSWSEWGQLDGVPIDC